MPSFDASHFFSVAGDIGIPPKIVALPPKARARTVEETSLMETVDVSITDEGGVTVVRVPIGTDEYVLG